jgi:hypothetical protein
MTSGNSNNITLPVNNIPATANRTNPVNHYIEIELSGVPSGTGMYQQLITINNPSDYNINSKGSNIQFTASNGTLLYAWIQSINSTTIQVWVKNYNGSSIIDMQVLPQFENLFSATGYLQSYSTPAVYQAPFNTNGISGTAYYANVSTFGQATLALNQSTTYRAYVNFTNVKFTGQNAYVSGWFWQSDPSAENYSRMLATSAGYSGWFEASSTGGLLYVDGVGGWTDTGYTLPTSPFYLAVYTNGTNGFYVYVNGNLKYHYTSVSGDNGNLEVGSTTDVVNSGNQFFGAFGDIQYSTTENLTQSSMPTYSIGYPVTISESGLPANTSWSFTFNGTLYTLTNTSYTILVNNGIYSLSVNAVNGYDGTYNSTIAVNFDDVNENIVFNFIYSINIIINNPDKAFYEITINENNNITHYNLTSSLITIHVINKNFPVTISINNLKKGYAISNPIISYDIAGNYSINEKIINTNNANNLVNNYTPYIIIVLILTALMIIGLIIKRGRE